MSVSHKFGTFCPKSGVGRGTEAFIYALSADETSPALALHATQSQPCFPAASNALALPGGNRIFRSNADRAYNTLHFASKVVCQGQAPLETPDNKIG